MLDKIEVRGARQHNLKNINLEIPRHKLTVVTGLSGIGQVEPRLRHHLRRRAAPVHRVAVRLCAPVPGTDGEARRRQRRGPVAGHQHRAEDHQPEPAFHGRDRDRNLRLHAAAVRLHRQAALPPLRAAHIAPEARPDRRLDPGLSGRDAGHDPGPRGPGSQGRVQEALREVRQERATSGCASTGRSTTSTSRSRSRRRATTRSR